MLLKWYGHAAFLIEAAVGTRIITDPYTPATSGYAPIPDAADLVVMSSDNDTFHCRADLLPGTPVVVNALTVAQTGGIRSAAGIPIRAVQAMEALNHDQHDPDQNGMYRMTVQGIEIGHMGDMGNALSPAQIDFFRGVDLLLALAGGFPALTLPDLRTVIEAVQPRYVVPMHFRTLRYKPRNMAWITDFLDLFAPEQVDFACDTQIVLEKAGLPATTRALVLTHAC